MADAGRLSSRLLIVGALYAVFALCGCTTSPPRPAPAVRAPSPTSADASNDWHALLAAPLGTLLKDMPVALTEVLQFHDAAQAGRGADDKDCYTSKAAAPQFLGQRPHDYLLCFDHDRLNRVEASVFLRPDGAAPLFAAACSQWQHRGTATGRTGETCEGRDGGIGYEAHLDAPATVSISLVGIAP